MVCNRRGVEFHEIGSKSMIGVDSEKCTKRDDLPPFIVHAIFDYIERVGIECTFRLNSLNNLQEICSKISICNK